MFNKVYVSSEDNEILEIARKYGAIPIRRPEKLCGDTPNIPVYQHALQFIKSPDVIIAVQANSPTIKKYLIEKVKRLMELPYQEIMTCHKDYSIYGSIWALKTERLKHYQDPYKQHPDLLLVDNSIDIHTEEDFKKAEKWSLAQS